MKIHHSLTFSIGLLVASTQIQAHEFWIEPSDHYTGVNQTIDITLKVGETFRGSAQPYLPEETANFVLINQTKNRSPDYWVILDLPLALKSVQV